MLTSECADYKCIVCINGDGSCNLLVASKEKVKDYFRVGINSDIISLLRTNHTEVLTERPITEEEFNFIMRSVFRQNEADYKEPCHQEIYTSIGVCGGRKVWLSKNKKYVLLEQHNDEEYKHKKKLVILRQNVKEFIGPKLGVLVVKLMIGEYCDSEIYKVSRKKFNKSQIVLKAEALYSGEHRSSCCFLLK